MKLVEFLSPDIVFIDINMPLINGLECLQIIKNNKEIEKVNTIIYSTGVNDDVYKLAIENGAITCVKKQATIHDLAAVLKNLLILI